MSPSELEQLYTDIFSRLSDYALIKTNTMFPYTIYNIAEQGWVVIEEHYEELVNLMLDRGVRVEEDAQEFRNPDFVRYVMEWDKEKNTWIKVPVKK